MIAVTGSAGEAAIVSDTVPRLTAHQAQSLTHYLDKHPERYQHILNFQK